MQPAKRDLTLFFPTPVWCIEFEGYEALNDALRKEFETVDWERLAADSVARFGADHTFREDRFVSFEQAPSIPVVQRFMALCDDIAHELHWDLTVHELVLTAYWVHPTEPGELTQAHTHKPSLLSGVYYVDKPADSGDLVFVDENPYREYGPKIVPGERNPLGDSEVVYPAQAGSMLIFPSWLTHKVPRNESTDVRRSLSFNAALGYREAK